MRKIAAGAVAGLLAGVLFGAGMQLMKNPDGDPVMAMVAAVVRSESLFVGWLYHLFNSAVIGAIFGWLLGSRSTSLASGAAWGLLYGFAWWIVGGLILMPLTLGMAAFAPLSEPAMRMVALGSLVGHAMYGLVLGAIYPRLFEAQVRPVGQLRPGPA